MKIYKSLDFLPIYNYYKISETGDLRYLYELEDYTCFEGLEVTSELKDIWNKIFSEHKNINLTLQYRYYECLETYFDYLFDKDNLQLQQKCNECFTKYLKQLDYEYKTITIEDIVFAPPSSYYEIFKKSNYDNFYLDRIETFDYHTIIGEKRKNNDNNIYEIIVFIKNVLDIDIDEHKTNCTKFFTLIDIAEKKIRDGKNKI